MSELSIFFRTGKVGVEGAIIEGPCFKDPHIYSTTRHPVTFLVVPRTVRVRVD